MNISRQVRLFGTQAAMNKDILFFVESGISRGLYTQKERKYTYKDDMEDHIIRWIVIAGPDDFMKISGLEFCQMTFDVTFPHDCLSYCLSRVRAPWRVRE